MSKLASFIKQNVDLLVVFVVSSIAFGQYFIDICSGYLVNGKLDLEYFLIADYAFFKNFIPNKDFTYSYGLLQYYRFENVLTLVISYLITPIIITAVFYFLKKIIKEKPLLYLSAGFLLVFSIKFNGANAISRYGVLVALSMLFSYLFYRYGKSSKFVLGCMGFVLGLVFSLINDQGTYLILSFIALYFLDDVIKKQIKSFLALGYYRATFKKILFIITGFLLGILPLIFYVIFNHAVLEYLRYFSDLSNIVLASKTPFLNFIASRDNLFSLSITTVALFYFFVKLSYFRNKINLSSYFQLGLILSILIMEQKSLIRSISGQITFASFILLIILIYDLISSNKYSRGIYRKIVIYTIVLFCITFLVGLKGDYILNFNPREIKDNIVMSVSGTCYANNLKAFLSKNNSYIDTSNLVKKQTDFNGKIFSFPSGNSVYYIIFKQKLPFYNSVGSDSSLYAQNNSIQYIQGNNIKYVIMPTSNSGYVLDDVPNYIREITEFKYILNNFFPVGKSSDNLVLAKRSNSDFFRSSILQEIPEYRNSLLNVNLAMIPYSEGLYKYKEVEKGSLLINANSQSNLNKSLRQKHVSSKNKVIVLFPATYSKSGAMNYLKIIATDGMESTVSFNACKQGSPCIINLSNIPSFYINRNIKSIQLDPNFKGEVKIFDLKNFGNLW